MGQRLWLVANEAKERETAVHCSSLFIYKMKVTVIQEHSSNYPNHITFEQGETLQLGKQDTEFKGWIRVTTQDGNEGWAPIQYIEFKAEASQGIAKCSYNANELNTTLSESLSVVNELNGWYLVSNAQGQVGWVPIQTVKIE